MNGLLSVVIPTFRRSDMLERAIESILKQTYKNIECIVVNDNYKGDEYSHRLYDIINKYSHDPRVKLVEQERHINGAAARNAGIRASQGEYIAFLDDDDYWEPNKAEIQICVLSNLDSSWGAVSCLMRVYNKNGLIQATIPYKDGYIHFDILSRRVSLGTGSLIIRRTALDQSGYWDESLYRFQDLQFFSYLSKKYKIKLISKYLHNRDSCDSTNRPTVEKYETLKNAFFESIEPLLADLPWKQQRFVKIMYNFESAYLYWKNGKKMIAAKNIIGVLRYPQTILYSIERMYKRFYTKRFRSINNKKYK